MARDNSLLVCVLSALIASAGTFFLLWTLDHGNALASGEVAVPMLVGMDSPRAQQVARARGLAVTVTEQTHDTVPRGQVASQMPVAGIRVSRGMPVQVVVSTGKPSLKMPALKGLPLEAAMQVLSSTGLKPGQMRRVHHEEVARGRVIDSFPRGGQPVGAGAQVSLVVSVGPRTSKVPRVIGLRVHRAKKTLREAGFELGRVRKMVNEDRSNGIILRQSPAPEEDAAKGSEVDVVVNAHDL